MVKYSEDGMDYTYSWNDIHQAAQSIALQMYNDSWNPDYIVGIVRDGLPLATILSHMIDTEMWTLNVDGSETNCWMADDAFGVVENQDLYKTRWDINQRKNILVVDSINIDGSKFEWIKKDWQSSCFPNEDYAWKSVWNKNVRFAVMTDVDNCEFQPDYDWHTIHTSCNPVVQYPYEYQLQV